MQKAIRCWWKKPKMTPTDGEIHHVPGLEESILWKWLYHPKQPTIAKNRSNINSMNNYLDKEMVHIYNELLVGH